MPRRQNQPNLLGDGETEKSSPLSLAEKKLKTVSLLFSKDMTAEEAEVWKSALCHYSNKAIEYAFDHWCKTERFFPKPAEIVSIMDEYNLSHRRPERQNYQYTGSGENEMILLYRYYLQRFPKKPDRFMTEEERDRFLDEFHEEMDKMRTMAEVG